MVHPEDVIGGRSDRQDIHITDLITFMQCRLKWAWSSPLRRGLQRVTLAPPLLVGQAFHRGVAAYYGSGRNLEAALDALGAMFKHVSDERLWPEERQSLAEQYGQTAWMLVHYAAWAARVDRPFLTIEPEVKFEFELDGLRVAGRFDGVAKASTTGLVFVLEYKTTSQPANAQWVMRSLQPVLYAYAASLMHGEVEGVVFRFISKKRPADPRFSVDADGKVRVDITGKTTRSWVLARARAYARSAGVPLEAVAEALRPYVGALTDEPYLTQHLIRYDPFRYRSVLNAVRVIGRQMLDPDVPIVATPSWACQWCAFRDPCDLFVRGMYAEAEALLRAEYAPRSYWEEEEG